MNTLLLTFSGCPVITRNGSNRAPRKPKLPHVCHNAGKQITSKPNITLNSKVIQSPLKQSLQSNDVTNYDTIVWLEQNTCQ